MSRAFIQKRLPFKPTDIGGCQLWLDAADVTTMILNGTKVTQWNDKSISGYNFTQATSGNQPTYSTASQNSLNTIIFTSANSTYLLGTASTTFMGTNSISVYGVFKINNNTSSSAVFSKSLYGSAAGRILYGFRESGTPATIAGGIGVASGPNAYTDIADTYTAGAWRTFGFVSDRSGWTNTTYQNGTSIGAVTISSDTTTNLTNPYQMLVGAYNNSSGGLPPQAGYFLDGAVGELLVFNTALTTAQRQQVESYLAQKWGLRQQLPQGHPGTRGIVYPSDPVNLLVRVPYQSAFVPTTAGNCQLWLDAADSTTLTGTSPVTQWRDKSGNARNTTTYAGTPALTTNAINSVQAINFNGGSSFTGSIPGSGTSYTVFFVGTFNNSTGTYGGFVCFGRSGTPDHVSGITNTKLTDSSMYSTIDSTNTAFTSNTLSTPFVYSLVIDGTFLNNFVNGNQQTPANVAKSASFNFTNYVVGDRAGSTSSIFLNGYVGEIIVYINSLATLQRQQVEGYLAWKWGLQANLPANHPYKNSAPNTPNQFGISRPPNVLPIPPITISARSRPIVQVLISSGLLARYRMNESSGSTVIDSIAGNNITIGGSPSRVSTSYGSYSGYALSIQNATQYGYITLPANMVVGTHSITSWVYFTGFPSGRATVWAGWGSGCKGENHAFYNDNASITIIFGGPSCIVALNFLDNNTNAVSPQLNTWYFCVTTWDGSTTWKTYCYSPTTAYAFTFSYGMNAVTSSGIFAIGISNNLDAQFGGTGYGGYIGEIRFYNRVLTAGEVASIYAGTG